MAGPAGWCRAVGEPATWAALIGLGAFHGINPAMGWLFAVGLGLQERRRRAVLAALPPLAVGHAAAILVTLAVVALIGAVVPPRALALAAGVVLIGAGVWLLLRRGHGSHRVGMRVGAGKLALWSFLMAGGHGAGLMLVPLALHGDLGGLADAGGAAGHVDLLEGVAAPSALVWLTVIHTLAMFVIMGMIAVMVYDVVGLRLLRRGWINLDVIWAGALIVAGAVTLVLA